MLKAKLIEVGSRVSIVRLMEGICMGCSEARIFYYDEISEDQ